MIVYYFKIQQSVANGSESLKQTNSKKTMKSIFLKKEHRDDYNGRPSAMITKERNVILKTHPYYADGLFYGRMYDFEYVDKKDHPFFLRCKDSINMYALKDMETILQKSLDAKDFETDSLTFEITSSNKIIEITSKQEQERVQKTEIEQCSSFLRELLLCNPSNTKYHFLDNDEHIDGVLESNDSIYLVRLKKDCVSYDKLMTFEIDEALDQEVYDYLENNDLEMHGVKLNKHSINNGTTNEQGEEIYFYVSRDEAETKVKHQFKCTGIVIGGNDEILIVYKNEKPIEK